MIEPKETGAFLHKELDERTRNAFKTLFETKHLYQSVSVDIEDALVSSRNLPVIYLPPDFPPDAVPPAPTRERVEEGMRGVLAGPWDVDGAQDHVAPRYSIMEGHLWISLPPIKVGCSRCKAAEAFKPVRCEDLCRKAYNAAPAMPEAGATYQLFACTYQCQRCSGVYEAFLVRRAGPKLTLCGRAPIAYIDVPAHIPILVRAHFANAAVAASSGQVLPGLFLLRTVIEQVVRTETGSSERPTEKILDAYMERLPQDFKNRFPSLRSIYDDLSAAMHEAREDDELFRRSYVAVSKHFEARKLFDL